MKPKIHILSTATLSDELLQKLSINHIEAEAYPFIHTTTVIDETAKQRIHDLEKFSSIVVFTSAKAAEIVGENLGSNPPWKIYCIQGATLHAVKKYFDKNAVIATAADASLLADSIIGAAPANIIFFCGQQRLYTLPAKLLQQGIAVEEIAVYETKLTPVPVTKPVQGVLFFSSSAVDSFFSVNEISLETICFAIGNTTANALRQKVSNRIVVAGQPGKREVVDLVIQYYHERC